MPVTITQGSKGSLRIDYPRDYQQLLSVIHEHFGLIPNLSKKLTYEYGGRTVFITDDASFQTAIKTFPKELHISLQQDGSKSLGFGLEDIVKAQY